MKACPRCQTPVPDQAAFCMKCGSPVAAGPVGFSEPKSYTWRWVIAGVALLAVAAGAFWLSASGVLRARAEQQEGNVLQVQGEPANPGLVQVPAGPADGGVLKADGPPEQTGMPPHIRAYLEHIERVERRRQRVTSDQLGAMMVKLTTSQLGASMETLQGLLGDDPAGADMTSPAVDFTEDIRQLHAEWDGLLTELNSVAPPPECTPLRSSYDRAMRETGAMMADVIGIVQNSSSDPQGAISLLNKMKDTSGHIDAAARDADAEVAAICERYNTRKWFSIMDDMGGGLMQKFGGL